MYSAIQPFISKDSSQQSVYIDAYDEVRDVLMNLLDTPVKSTQHIGGTRHFQYQTEPILDVLVGVDSLHDITSLDEKRLNYVGFYRLHHKYRKKVVMARFNNLIDLKQEVRLHIIQRDTDQFEHYLFLDGLLSENPDVQHKFETFKLGLKHRDLGIRQYEIQKEKFFSKILKKYS